jgi:hypothetical protein
MNRAALFAFAFLSPFSLLSVACDGGVDSPASEAPERPTGFQTALEPTPEPTTPAQSSGNPGDVGTPGGDTPPASGGSTTPTTGGPQGADEADTGLNCSTVYDQVSACYTTYYTCASACDDDACGQTCEANYTGCYGAQVALGSSAAQSAFDALRTCEDTHWDPCYASGGEVYEPCAADCADEACAQECANEANDVLQVCMNEACAEAYAACGVGEEDEPTEESEAADPTQPDPTQPDPGSGSGGSSGMACGALYTCEDGCNGNETCGQACYSQGTDQAKSQWTQLIQCGMSYCNGQVASADAYKTCLSEMCPQEYGLCFSGGAGNGGGSGASGGTSCGEGYTCIQTCYSTAYDAASFSSCVSQCEGAMGSQAAALMETLTGCANVQCYDVPGSLANYYKCIEDFCSPEYMACIDQPADNSGSGSGSTAGIDTCLDVHFAVSNLCVPEYSSCIGACNDQSCADACSGEIAACIQAKQNSAPYEAGQDFAAVLSCRQSNFDTCNGEADAVLGTCDAACGAGDQACIDGCIQSSDEAYEACYTEVCADAYAACGITDGDQSSPPGGDTPDGGSATGGGHGSCLAIYDAVQALCDAGYVTCSQGCSDQPCADACAADANACVDDQKANATNPSDATDYEAVLTCWNTNYDSCYGEGGEVYQSCMGDCTDGEDACKESCNAPAMAAYATCYQVVCTHEYATCGIE